jgi:hypothetical protein
MKITKDQLRQIIKEEVNKSLQTEFLGFGKKAKRKKEISKILDKNVAEAMMKIVNRMIRRALGTKLKSHPLEQARRQLDLREKEELRKVRNRFNAVAPQYPEDIDDMYPIVADALQKLAQLDDEAKEHIASLFGGSSQWDNANADSASRPNRPSWLLKRLKDESEYPGDNPIKAKKTIIKLLVALKEIGFDLDSHGIKALSGDTAPDSKEVPTNSIKDYLEFYKKALG